MFGIKDIFTTINLMGGVVAVCLCIDGQPFAAGVAVLVGYLVGDTLDGWVARKLNSANEFGAEYDTISDHMAHVIAPAAIVYTVYRDAGLLVEPYGNILAIALAGSIVAAVSIRHARNIAKPISTPGIWGGLPRTVVGFLAIGYANAALTPYLPGGLWVGVVLIPLAAITTLSRWPFVNHRIPRPHFLYAKVAIAFAFGSTIAIAIFAPAFVFDVMFFNIFGYSVAGWMALTKDERAEYRKTVRAALA